MRSKADPKGIKNVNFSCYYDNDARSEEFTKQRLERGFDESELWNLDNTIAKFILPRLKAFKECTLGYPGTMSENEWENMLDKMIKSFETYISDETPFKSDKEVEDIKEGLSLFAQHFFNLWY